MAYFLTECSTAELCYNLTQCIKYYKMVLPLMYYLHSEKYNLTFFRFLLDKPGLLERWLTSFSRDLYNHHVCSSMSSELLKVDGASGTLVFCKSIFNTNCLHCGQEQFPLHSKLGPWWFLCCFCPLYLI